MTQSCRRRRSSMGEQTLRLSWIVLQAFEKCPPARSEGPAFFPVAYTSLVAIEQIYCVYVGVTSQIVVRVSQHRSGSFEGSTRRHGCHGLVRFERFGFNQNGISRERGRKGWRREKKVGLMERENPMWVDVSEGLGNPAPTYGWSAGERLEQVLRSAQDDAWYSVRI